MAAEVFWDTSGFFALLNTDDPAHAKARQLAAERGILEAATTDEHFAEAGFVSLLR